jgi:hypothetical protein
VIGLGKCSNERYERTDRDIDFERDHQLRTIFGSM